MHVSTVRRHSEQSHHSLVIKDVTQGRSLTNVVRAVKPLAIDSRLLFIREFIPEKNPISVRSVARLSIGSHILKCIIEFILAKNPMHARNVGKPLVIVLS